MTLHQSAGFGGEAAEPSCCHGINETWAPASIDRAPSMQAEVAEAVLAVAAHDVDLQNPLCWLARPAGGGAFAVPPGHDSVNPVRQVHPLGT